VSDGIYRGGRADLDGLKELDKLDINTIINLEVDQPAINFELKNAKALGMDVVLEPMRWDEKPNDKEVAQILETIKNKAAQNVFIHCKHGQDRTGLIIGLYRVKYQDWTPKQAYEEMLKNNFHPKYTELDNYFREQTGYKD
jgi:protein tyrosine/serine phosphatase